MEDRDSDPFSTYQENKLLLNSIFMKEKMSKYSKQLIDQYFKSLLRAHKRVETTRDLMEVGMIQDIGRKNIFEQTVFITLYARRVPFPGTGGNIERADHTHIP